MVIFPLLERNASFQNLRKKNKMATSTSGLKAIILVHWMLSIWGITAWLPAPYAWANFTMLALGVWAVAQKDSIDAALMFLLGLLVTILTDMVQFGLYYAGGTTTHVFQFSFSMAIFSLLLKPVSCFYAYRLYRERGGSYSLGFTISSQNQGNYETIDPQAQSNGTSNP